MMFGLHLKPFHLHVNSSYSYSYSSPSPTASLAKLVTSLESCTNLLYVPA